MAEVETVRGPVDVGSLGQVLLHEHLFTPGTEMRQNYPDCPDRWDEDYRVADAVTKVKECAPGTPITVHASAHLHTGLIAQKILQGGGRRPRQGRDRALWRRGGPRLPARDRRRRSILGMDRFGIDVVLPFEDRVNTVAALARDGYADRMVLGHDSSCDSDFYPEQRLMTMLPKWTLVHISDDVLPALRERGVIEDQITTMLVDNPRRYFTGAQA